MGKQKVVLKVTMEDAKKRSKALRIAVGLPGVISAALEGAEKNQIVVISEGIDSVALTTMLRKRMGYVDLVSVAAIEENKEKKEKEAAKPVSVQPVTWPYQFEVRHPFSYEIRDPNPDPCCIM